MARLIGWSASFALAALLVPPGGVSAQAVSYEVWVVDQADAGNGGSKIYIYPGAALGGPQLSGQAEVVDLEVAAQGSATGPGVRLHLLLFNSSHSHGILAYVASGHVQIIRSTDRKVVASIDVGVQAHGAVPAPDDSFLLVANQNGKRLARISSDFGREQFSYNAADDLDLGRSRTSSILTTRRSVLFSSATPVRRM